MTFLMGENHEMRLMWSFQIIWSASFISFYIFPPCTTAMTNWCQEIILRPSCVLLRPEMLVVTLVISISLLLSLPHVTGAFSDTSLVVHSWFKDEDKEFGKLFAAGLLTPHVFVFVRAFKPWVDCLVLVFLCSKAVGSDTLFGVCILNKKDNFKNSY